MGEGIQIQGPIYKLAVRFSNGELLHYVVREPINPRLITAETRYAIISSILCENPSDCTGVTLVNMRDVTFIRTERVTVDQLAGEHRMAGIRSGSASNLEEKLIKVISDIKFV